MKKQTRQQLMIRLAEVQSLLAEYSIHGAPGYAEVLVAEALGGHRESNGVNQGFDVMAPIYGRIEVKCRQLPLDGRREDRVDLRDTKAKGFDYLAIVIFYPDYSVKGAVLAPYSRVWPLVDSRRYRRVSYGEACQLDEAVDISELVSAAAQR